MIRTPRHWRDSAGKTQAEVAKAAGIGGRNPSRTYNRYESGESPCPAKVIDAIARLSGRSVTAQHWHDIRMVYLRKGKRVGAHA